MANEWNELMRRDDGAAFMVRGYIGAGAAQRGILAAAALDCDIDAIVEDRCTGGDWRYGPYWIRVYLADRERCEIAIERRLARDDGWDE